MDDVFGPILIGRQVEIAVQETLALWMRTAIQEIELQLGFTRGEIPAPRTYTARNEFTSFPDDRMPLMVIVSTGLADPPMVDGEGTYSAWWAIGVGSVALGPTGERARMLSQIYAAAARWILLNQPAMPTLNDQGVPDADSEFRTSGVVWMDESYDDPVVTEEKRTIHATVDIFRVKTENVVNRNGGPLGPPDPVNQPGSQWPTADTIEIDIEVVN